jgi:glycosyltransferase involved in cell wall biosynthesis
MKYKIAYINYSIVPVVGIDKKNIAQANAISKLNINNFDVIILNPFVENKIVNNIKYIKLKQKPGIFKYIDYIFKYNLWRFKDFTKQLDCGSYDYLIIRYLKADKTAIQFFKKHNVISEHHTFEEKELFLEYKTTTNILEKFAKLLRWKLEIIFGDSTLSLAKGIIGVTNEIRDFQVKRTGIAKHSTTVSNGIEIDKVAHTKYLAFNNKTLNIVYISSVFAAWKGIDRIIHSIDNCASELNIKLHLIGRKEKSYNKYDFIVQHGFLHGQELDNIFAKTHIAVGALALHRKGISEGSTLKVREYIARGLPFILAYQDIDIINNPPQKKFYLEFPNDDSPIDFNKIINFVKEINQKYEPEELSAYMRSYAEKYLDWTVKMKQYVDFVNEIAKM